MKRFNTAILIIVFIFLSTGSSISYADEAIVAKNNAGELKEVIYTSNKGYEAVHISSPGYSDYSCMELSDPSRIVIDIDNVSAPGKQVILPAEGKYVKRIRYAQFTTKTGRVVLEVKEGYNFTVVAEEDGLEVYVSEKPTAERLNASKAILFGDEYGIQFVKDGSAEAISMTLGKVGGYSVKRLTDPERLILTIPDAGVIGMDSQVDINGTRLKSFSYKKIGKSGVSIVLYLNGQYQYSFEESDNKLVMNLQWPSYKNVYYHNYSDRVFFELKNAKLTEGDEFLTPLYTSEYNETEKEYTITFPTMQADLGEGKLDINDSYLKSFEIRNNAAEGTTSIIFAGAGKNSYLAYTRKSGLTAITVFKPAVKGQKVVVIDPGHGGVASGAVYGSLLEKDLNLDISKRLNALLKKKGVKTYMIRVDDSDVDNYERAYIANMLQADLFLSVHNNAMNYKSYRGTMTLYCPSTSSGFSGYEFAKIVQKNLLSSLKTKDREVRSRPDLIVLKATAMPAVIAEVAYMTNSYDRANLQKESFRQKAAQALYQSVIQSLPKL